MDIALIRKCEAYMQTCLRHDMAHDSQHIYRVLKIAMDIASHETGVDQEQLIIACLLHDIGRKVQQDNPSLCHADRNTFLKKKGIGHITTNLSIFTGF